ncbi:hypothetical protein HS125_18020 [bacterium]|nr:hypothetical protein [bacterium]
MRGRRQTAAFSILGAAAVVVILVVLAGIAVDSYLAAHIRYQLAATRSQLSSLALAMGELTEPSVPWLRTPLAPPGDAIPFLPSTAPAKRPAVQPAPLPTFFEPDNAVLRSDVWQREPF